MRTVLLAVATCLTLCPSIANATDLAKIERTITKEPVYQAKPKYCLLVFGPEAKTRVWLVVDGKTLYVDRNGNGDLTEAGEQLAGKADIWFDSTIPAAASGGQPAPKLQVIGSQQVGFSISLNAQACKDILHFAETKAKAPICHFDGPIHFTLAQESKLERTGGLLRVYLETPGLGPNTLTRVLVTEPLKKIHPLAELEFPNKDKTGPPIKLKVSLPLRPC